MLGCCAGWFASTAPPRMDPLPAPTSGNGWTAASAARVKSERFGLHSTAPASINQHERLLPLRQLRGTHPTFFIEAKHIVAAEDFQVQQTRRQRRSIALALISAEVADQNDRLRFK